MPRAVCTCIGLGPIGMSWSRLLSRHGFQVYVYDISDHALDKAEQEFGKDPHYARGDNRSFTFASPTDGGDLMGRITLCKALTPHICAVDYIIDCTPEREAIKRTLVTQLENMMGDATIMLSSTSGIPVSAFVSECSFRTRCLVAHPINPPDLIPLVEICPAPFTDQEVVDRVLQFMKALGKVPVLINKEVPGFVANRLALALYREATALVGAGVISPGDLEAVMTQGLGVRWAAAGPSETYHLNQDDTYKAYFERVADHLDEIVSSLSTAPSLSADGVQKIANHQDSEHTPLEDRRRARNKVIEDILRVREPAFADPR